MDETKIVFSVGEYIALLNEHLKFFEARVEGEVSEVKIWSSGHVYFTLRDKRDNAILDCVIWKGVYEIYGIQLKVGMELIVNGNSNIYAPRGRLSFIANSIELVGEGALKRAYDELKQKLTQEGLFTEERKKKLPKFPRKIGIITSKHGAVIHDFMNNLNKHGFQVAFLNSRVEGSESLRDLLIAFRTMKKQDVDVIVLMRGGGSLQSLAAFDAEVLVREVASSSIPVIAAIGHHQDIPLCALAADVMVSTPTAAANAVCEDWEKGLLTVSRDYQRILLGYTRLLNDITMTLQLRQVKIMEKFNRILTIFDYTKDHMAEYIAKVSGSLVKYSETLTRHTQHIMSHMSDALIGQVMMLDTIQTERIYRSFAFALKQTENTIISKEKLIQVYNPMRQLALGYSIIRDGNGKLVKSIKDLSLGEMLTSTAADGTIISEIKQLKNHE